MSIDPPHSHNSHDSSSGNSSDGSKSATVRTPSFLQALLPVAVLICLLTFSVFLYGEDASQGANQIALCVGAMVAALIGWRNGMTWDRIEASIISGVGVAVKPILILFSVGLLIGSWIMSGTVPTMIYYSLLLLDPSIYYAAACLICAFIALSIGSSWTVAGTIGIALIGAAAGMGLRVDITAGAIISGAYFGDKMSPLSETTNLAPAVVGTDLFTHIGHMVWTTLPAIIIALIIYVLLGLNIDQAASADDLAITLRLLEQHFTLNLLMLLPVVVLLVMANRKLPAIPTILTGAAVAIVLALLFQRTAIMALTDGSYDIEVTGTIVDNEGEATLPVAGASDIIVDNEGEATLSVVDATATENMNLVFIVSLSPVSDEQVTVDYATADDTAIAGEDYAQAAGTLTFAPGAANMQVTVPVINDNIVENDEVLTLTLSNGTNAALGDAPNIFLGLFPGVWTTLFDGFVLSSGNESLDDLMSGGGMSSMLRTVWLILCAMVFGAVMEFTGLLQRLVDYALSFVHSTGSLIVTTIATCIGANIITSDQYIAVVLPGRMYKMEYMKRHLDVKNLSRALEDSGTVTSPLVPWNTCGAYMSGTLSVATFTYLPFCFFNLICPLVSILYGITNIKIAPATAEQEQALQAT
ncbi:MAG: Na+/H+ antiporter NhaC family protein [Pseudohongiellaceae bacterium]